MFFHSSLKKSFCNYIIYYIIIVYIYLYTDMTGLSIRGITHNTRQLSQFDFDWICKLMVTVSKETAINSIVMDETLNDFHKLTPQLLQFFYILVTWQKGREVNVLHYSEFLLDQFNLLVQRFCIFVDPPLKRNATVLQECFIPGHMLKLLLGKPFGNVALSHASFLLNSLIKSSVKLSDMRRNKCKVSIIP